MKRHLFKTHGRKAIFYFVRLNVFWDFDFHVLEVTMGFLGYGFLYQFRPSL